jgi:ArsR family transcriptional regulator
MTIDIVSSVKKRSDADVLLLQALADPTRLAIVRQLSAVGPTCACDLTDRCGVSQPTTSHHLKVLREAGWITGERRGTWIWYTVRPQAVERLQKLTSRLSPVATAPATGRPGGTGLPIIQPT